MWGMPVGLIQVKAIFSFSYPFIAIYIRVKNAHNFVSDNIYNFHFHERIIIGRKFIYTHSRQFQELETIGVLHIVRYRDHNQLLKPIE